MAHGQPEYNWVPYKDVFIKCWIHEANACLKVAHVVLLNSYWLIILLFIMLS